MKIRVCMCLWHFSLLKLTKANIFEDIYFNRERNDFDLSVHHPVTGIEWVLNPLGNIHKNQNKTPLKWIYFYYSMVFFPSCCSQTFLDAAVAAATAVVDSHCVCVQFISPQVLSSARSLACCSGIKWPYEFLCVRIHISNWWRSWGCWTWFDMVSLGL